MRKQIETVPATAIIALGRGVEARKQTDGSTLYVPGAAHVARAHAVGQYVEANRRFYGRRQPLIVAAGGFALTAANQEPLPMEWREGSVTQRILWEKYRLDSELEPNSGDTYQNFTETARLGYLDGFEFSPDSPLGIGAGKMHAMRATPIAERVFFDGPAEAGAIHTVLSRGERELVQGVKEVAGMYVVHHIFEIEDTDYGDIEAVEHAGRTFAELTAEPVEFLRAAVLGAA